MMLKEERHTAHAVAFSIEIPQKTTTEPQIKKRLEADAIAAKAPNLTLEQIRDKLEKADIKRKQKLDQSGSLNRKDRERSKKVNERKDSFYQERERRLKGKLQNLLPQAE